MFKLVISFKGKGPFVQYFGCKQTAYATLDVYMATCLVTGYKISIEENSASVSKKLQLV